LSPELRVAEGLRAAAAAVLAFSVVVALVPVAIGIARRTRFFDEPAGYKDHEAATPYLGGLALCGGFSAAVLAVPDGVRRFWPLLVGCLLLWAVGTADDRRTVRPLARVAVELAVGAFVWTQGLGWATAAPAAVDLALTLLWVLAIVNAVNLMDNMDGAACSVGAACLGGTALLALAEGDAMAAALALALAAATAGFLPANLAGPARIFLGDGGSMPLGLALAGTVMAGPVGSDLDWAGPLAALVLTGLLALDTTLVVISRWRRRAPIYLGGRDHLTHRMRSRLPSARAVALRLAAIQAALGVLVLLADRLGPPALVALTVAYCGACAVAIYALEGARLPTSLAPAQPR
jgi:UDP-GlcNAc:undecaprenyl-phosphate GlcNAc-1-phosphate transferase